MQYYHGTDKSFRNFDLSKAENYKDFGIGVYLSEEFWHAESVAKKRNGEHAYVMEYNVNIEEMRKVLKVKEFKKTSEPWLKFVLLNRNTLIKSEYDAVIGATADAAAQTEIEKFYRNHKNRKPSKKEYRDLLVRLAVHKYPKQICLLSQKAVDYFDKKYSKTHTVY